MDINRLVGSANDILLDYYFKQVDCLKGGLTFNIDFSKESSSQMVLIQNHIISSFLCKYSSLYSSNKFDTLSMVSKPVDNTFDSISYYRSCISTKFFIFEDDIIDFSFNQVSFIQNNLKDLDLYERQTNFLFDFLAKLQTIKGKAQVKFKLVKAGVQRTQFEESIGTERTCLEYGREAIKKITHMFSFPHEFNDGVLLQRLKYFNLTYPNTINLSDSRVRERVLNSIKESPYFDDPLLMSSFLNRMISDRNNPALDKLSFEAYQVDKLTLERQLLELSKGLVYEN